MMQKPLKLVVLFVVLALVGLGIFSIFDIYLSRFMPENKVVYLRTQQARGTVIKMSGNKVTLEKEGSTLDVVIPADVLILRNVQNAAPSETPEASGSSMPVEDSAFVEKASFSDIKVGSDLSISFKWMNGNYVVESVILVN